MRRRLPFLVVVLVLGVVGLLLYLQVLEIPLEVASTTHRVFNYAEAAVWTVAAACVLWGTRSRRPPCVTSAWSRLRPPSFSGSPTSLRREPERGTSLGGSSRGKRPASSAFLDALRSIVGSRARMEAKGLTASTEEI